MNIQPSGAASFASVEEAIALLTAQAQSLIESERRQAMDSNEDACIPEAPLDGKPSRAQFELIQQRIDEALTGHGLHAILFYAPSKDGGWSIGIISLVDLV